MLSSDQFKPKSNLKLIKKFIFSEDEQFPLTPKSGGSVRFSVILPASLLCFITGIWNEKNKPPVESGWKSDVDASAYGP